jgi:hypothetical protein
VIVLVVTVYRLGLPVPVHVCVRLLQECAALAGPGDNCLFFESALTECFTVTDDDGHQLHCDEREYRLVSRILRYAALPVGTSGKAQLGRSVFSSCVNRSASNGLGSRHRAFLVGINGGGLDQCVEDASRLGSVLLQAGFSVTLLLDVGKTDFKRNFDAFVNDVGPYDTVLFFFSGHGAVDVVSGHQVLQLVHGMHLPSDKSVSSLSGVGVLFYSVCVSC